MRLLALPIAHRFPGDVCRNGTGPLAGIAGDTNLERTARMRIPGRRMGRVIVALAVVGMILLSTVASHGCLAKGASPADGGTSVASE